MKKKNAVFLKTLKWLVIPGLLIYVLARGYFSLTDDFRISNITYPIPYEETWQIADPSIEEELNLKKILNQPYFYLGKGAQSYVFASEDQKYVLKFFKFKHLRPSLLVDSLPSIGYLKTYKDKLTARKQRKLYGVFKSYKLAFDKDKDESGLIFVQLNTEGNPSRSVTIFDKIGFKRNLDLQNYAFILQYKGQTLRVVLGELLKNGNVKKANKHLEQILDLYASEYNRGIYDHDHGIMQNTGFIKDTPIHLDVGKLLPEEKMRDKYYAKKDAQIVIDNINLWVEKNYPQFSNEIADFLHNKINQLYPSSNETKTSIVAE